MKKILSYISWSLVVAIYWAIAYFGFVAGIIFLANGFMFLCWFLFLTTTLMWLTFKADRNKAAKGWNKRRPVNKHVDILSDVIGAFLLAGTGHFVLACITIFQCIFLQEIHEMKEAYDRDNQTQQETGVPANES